ncbi:MAG: DUF721 domain-containing protein [Rickettsiales bacterium]|jgi:hypothetical protein|nr:DUF721 domain-containing protein [Rickettsiales bacterium]
MKYQGVHQLHDLIFSINKPLIGKKGVYYQKLLKDWSRIVGEDLARDTIPTKISSVKRKKNVENTLYLATNNAASSAELVYHIGIIKEQINNYFGYEYIRQIKLTQAIFKTQPIHDIHSRRLSSDELIKLNDLMTGYNQDDEIKESLKNLATSILSSKL